MEIYDFDKNIFSKDHSPLFFPNLLSENEINISISDKDDNASYHSHNENNFQFSKINSFNNVDDNYKAKTYCDTAPLLKGISKKSNNFDFNSLDEIKYTLKSKCLTDDTKKLIGKIINLESEEGNMKSGKTINIDNDKKNYYEKLEEKEEKNNYLKKKRGRKTEDEFANHDKYNSDNIIKKIKSRIINKYLLFINRMINPDKLLKIKYKYIDNLSIKNNLELLEKPLKDFFSLKVSKRYTSNKENSNENLIKEIFKKSSDKTIQFLFKITLNDWINLYTYKEEISTLAKKYEVEKVDCAKITKNFEGVEHLLKEFSEQTNAYYYSLFLLHIFNYQRWFCTRKKRNHYKKKRKNGK